MKRKYDSSSRRKKSGQTREAIAEAARALFATRGFELVTIDEIAEKAGKPIPTVYALFGSKKGILKAVIEGTLFGREYEALVEQTKEITEPLQRLRGVAKITRSVYDAESAETNLLRGAVLVAPEFAELEREIEQRRFKRQETNIRQLAAAKAIRAGMSVSQARDILWALTGREPYRLLVLEKGWSSARYEKWLGDLLVRALLSSDINGEKPGSAK